MLGLCVQTFSSLSHCGGFFCCGAEAVGSESLFAPWHMGSFQTRNQSGVPCIGRQILIHWTTKEVLAIFWLDWFCFWGLFCFFVFVLAQQLLWNSPKMMCLSVAHSLLLLVAFHCMDFTSWWDICVVSHEFTFFKKINFRGWKVARNDN